MLSFSKLDVETRSGIHPFLDKIKYTVSQPSSGLSSELTPPGASNRLAGMSSVTCASNLVIIPQHLRLIRLSHLLPLQLPPCYLLGYTHRKAQHLVMLHRQSPLTP